ncbi:group III truncated hemoglobin [Chitinimonas koreensis]|uniref:group III truncated hemoglobin n=1 Tax=Chitinimonas koreensis TaxID=356302 RepID=UPI0003FBE080|nr:group III truncated hemoglobin [Chitinimonas koreensis]QNM97432.1 group III truncated hemoglobin [Chitinimonas koreensis]
MRDIALEIGRERVGQVVDEFYRQVRRHPTLAGPFARVDDWPAHLERLTHFWWVTLGGERYLDYRYAVPARHAEAGFTPALLHDWLALFRQVVRAQLAPEQAGAWITRAERIGESLRLMHELGHFPAPAGPSIVAIPR